NCQFRRHEYPLSCQKPHLIQYLLKESVEYAHMQIPADEEEQKQLLRALFNIRMPQEVPEEFLQIQDAYLQEENRRKGIVDYKDLLPVQEGIYLWQGDISSLKCGAIVNAANSQMLGCFRPNHNCIDNSLLV
ncbi:MAG: hypothetical protein Q4B26_20260, partial [Eubacteriales bacterium]|nr:hypothetical protein [Eubacteriales bacterium]